MSKLDFDKVFKKAKDLGIEELDITLTESKKMSISCLDKTVENREIAQTAACYLRGLKNGIVSSGYTEDLSDSSIEKALLNIKEGSKFWDTQEPNFFYEGDKDYKKLEEEKYDIDKRTIEEKLHLLDELNTELGKACDFFHSSSEYEEKTVKVTKRNTKGLKVEQITNITYIYGSIVLKRGEEAVTEFDLKFLTELDKADVKTLAKEVIEGAKAKFDASPVKTDKYKVILRNNVVADLLSSYSSIFKQDKVLDKQSFLEGKLGTKIFGANITITDNPFLKENPTKPIFDDEGVATRVNTVVSNGVLTQFLQNLSTANRVGLKSTGNGSGSGSNIGISFHAMCLEGGNNTFKTLEEKLKDGVVITQIMGLHAGINAFSGEFNLQAQGYEVKNGQRTKAVNLIVLSGQIEDVLNNVECLGNDYKYSLSGVYAPSILVKSMNISGK